MASILLVPIVEFHREMYSKHITLWSWSWYWCHCCGCGCCCPSFQCVIVVHCWNYPMVTSVENVQRSNEDRMLTLYHACSMGCQDCCCLPSPVICHSLQHSFYDCWELKLHFLQHSFYDCQEIKRTVASSNHPHVCKIFIMRKLPWQKYWPSTSSGPAAQNEKFHLLSPLHQFSGNFEATALLKLKRKTIHKPISNTPQKLVGQYGAKLLQRQQSSVVMRAGPTKAHLYITKI